MTELAERVENVEESFTGGAGHPDPGSCVAVVCPDCAAEAGYFAAGLARRLAERKPLHPPRFEAARAVLVDGLPGAGGLDVIADLESAPGARWAALRGATGGIDADRLLRALPQRDGVAVLAHGRARDPVAAETRVRTLRALGDSAGWLVGTQPPDRLPDDVFSSVVLLARGSVAGLAAAQKYVEQLGDELPVVIVSLETPGATRGVVADSLSRPLVSATPTRWRLSAAAAPEIVAGVWPGSKDRVLHKVLDEVAVYVCSRGRSVAWV